MKLTIQNRVAKVDVEPNARSRTYSRSSRLHVRMFKKSEHEQEASNESSMYDKVVCWCDTQDKEKSQETLGGLIPAIVLDVRFGQSKSSQMWSKLCRNLRAHEHDERSDVHENMKVW